MGHHKSVPERRRCFHLPPSPDAGTQMPYYNPCSQSSVVSGMHNPIYNASPSPAPGILHFAGYTLLVDSLEWVEQTLEMSPPASSTAGVQCHPEQVCRQHPVSSRPQQSCVYTTRIWQAHNVPCMRGGVYFSPVGWRLAIFRGSRAVARFRLNVITFRAMLREVAPKPRARCKMRYGARTLRVLWPILGGQCKVLGSL